MKPFSLLLFFVVILSGAAPSSAQTNLEWATLAAPEAHRENATVYGYDENGTFVLLREGSNHLVCIGDDPAKEGFSVVAYHKDLDPFMARGRELKAMGKSLDEIFATREAEAQSGQLVIPDKSTLTVYQADLDENGSPINPYLRYVVYIPFATAEETGLPTGPMSDGGPWIMDPGTHRAHIMITPARKD
ncbi:MAG: hypothetical protein RIC30_11930 [Marinoscillum sp.]|uniref:hypothetical protein n=1 Tax=Marinoscillum sp. TaxID=2024838 RepID=UPI0032F44F13